MYSRSPLIVDDIYPSNSCDGLLQKADILYVIPNLGGEDISNSKKWCNYIKSLNKTLGLHGITHSYHEFDYSLNQEEISLAIKMFEGCFGEKPSLFRPPYNRISKDNQKIVESLNMTVYKKRFWLHPYCHCNPHSFMKPLNWILFCD